MKKLGIITTVMLFCIVSPVQAAETPTLITGAQALLDAALGWVLWLIPSGAAVMLGYHAFSKSLSEGDMAKTEQHNRAMKNILVAAAIGFTAAGTVKAVLSFFGG